MTASAEMKVRSDSPAKARQTVWLHPVIDIEPDPNQPRIHFDMQDLRDLQQNLQSQGLHEPIHVISNPDFGNKKGAKPYRIVAGERRWRAACALKWEKIEAFIEPDDCRTLVFQLTENLQHASLSAVEEGRGFARLQSEYGLSVEEIAAQVGRSRFHVYQQLGLLRLHPDLQKLSVGGVLPASVGYLLVQKCADEQEQLQVMRALRVKAHGTTLIREVTVRHWFEARDRRQADRESDGKSKRLPRVSRQVLEGIGPLADKLARYLEEFAGSEGSGELSLKFFEVWRKLQPDQRKQLLRSMRTIQERSGALLRFFAAQRSAAIGQSRIAAHDRKTTR